MISEAEWKRHVISIATLCGWKCCHVSPAMTKRGKWTTPTSVKGWPDWCMYRPGDFLFAELKSDIGVLSVEQNAVLADLKAAGVDVYCWAPRDREHVERRLGVV